MCSVIVNNFNIGGAYGSPLEANAPLGIDAYAVLAFAVAQHRFQHITRRRTQKPEGLRSVELGKFAFGYWQKRLEPPRGLALKKRLCILAPERNNHAVPLIRAKLRSAVTALSRIY
jgi:hypothetical protein